jgi:hypothetical protein
MDYDGFERFVDNAGISGILNQNVIRKIFDEQTELVTLEKND